MTDNLLVNIPGVEIADVGFWDISNAKGFHPTAEKLAAAVAAQDCPAVRRPTLKFGHTGTPGEGDPAIGSVDNLRLSDDGMTLIGDYVGVPAWLGQPDENGNSIMASAYPDRSGEFQEDYVCQLGHTHPFVVHAVALLGVVAPGIGTLESLLDLYAKAPTKEKTTMASTSNASVTADKVTKAYYSGPAADDWNLWVREMYVDPPELIVQNDADDTLLRVPYSVNGDEVEFSDGQAVRVEYVNARARLPETRMYACATKTESRPAKMVSTPVAASSPEPNNEGGGVVNDLATSIREHLGLSEDATEEQILEALDKAKGSDPAPEVPTTVQEQAPVTEVPEVQAASVKDGIVTLDAGAFDQLTKDAAAGREARNLLAAQERESVLSAAISTGRVAPAKKEFWAARLSENFESTKSILEELPRVIPVDEIGHSNPAVQAASVTEADVRNTEIYKGWDIR